MERADFLAGEQALWWSRSDQQIYFAHSYHMTFAEELNELKVAVTDHGGEVTAAFEKDLVAGSQFHPEKSHRFGMELLKNFGVWAA